MSRFQRHLGFIFRTLGYAILLAVLLTIILFRWLSAGHASPVVFLVPGLFVAHLVCGPALLEPGPDRGTRISAIALSAVVFCASLGLTYLIATAGGSEVFYTMWLALPVVHLLTSSLLLEAVYRVRGKLSPPTPGGSVPTGGPANPA